MLKWQGQHLMAWQNELQLNAGKANAKGIEILKRAIVKW